MSAPDYTPTEYVLGFAFQGSKVILIKKLKPAFQRGKLNGVGGKVESKEPWARAMVREFEEETGVSTNAGGWVKFAILQFPLAAVHCYATVLPDDAFPMTRTDETVTRVNVNDVLRNKNQVVDDNSAPFMSNVPWLVAMARSALGGVEAVNVVTSL